MVFTAPAETVYEALGAPAPLPPGARVGILVDDIVLTLLEYPGRQACSTSRPRRRSSSRSPLLSL